ncbi:MAG TPA: Gfo/Idh/MocA family oxidoreductase [Tepidisphaeraceae bacterium]|jgi:predicted dehydrogenase|nr:Gfo/Idh/MocA family oxidoreductase [Tepidisphaeraceae bacterium]
MKERIRVGVIGCGAISGRYLQTSRGFPVIEIAACADLNRQAAEKKAAEFAVPRVLEVDELLADKSIDLVLNLTVPKAHAPLSLAALKAGKHVYVEKPLAVTRADGQAILNEAKNRNLLVGCAPDTFLGWGLQTARKAIDDGLIGNPVAFTAFMMCPGHEHWHPSPEFYYQAGGGPMLDMGPYYLTALLNCLGPVKRLSGLASVAIPERTISSEPNRGKKVSVETPDHITGSIEFEQGAVGTIVTSFATRFAPYDGKTPITIFGTGGTLLVPDPNGFGGPVRLRKNVDADFNELPAVFAHQYERSVGVADMAYAIQKRRPVRASGEQAFAVLDLMLGFLDSSRDGKEYRPVSKYTRPAPLPTKTGFGVLDE